MERNINMWLLLTCPLLGTWPATQACALTGNPADDPLVGRLVLSPLSRARQGRSRFQCVSFLAVEHHRAVWVLNTAPSTSPASMVFPESS